MYTKYTFLHEGQDKYMKTDFWLNRIKSLTFGYNFMAPATACVARCERGGAKRRRVS